MCSLLNSSRNILAYEKDIWSSCDVVRGHIKESNLPNLMMPFFALIMVESRLVREYHLLMNEYYNDDADPANNVSKQDFIENLHNNAIDTNSDKYEEAHQDSVETIQDSGNGYNSVILEDKKRLYHICQSSTNFETDFEHYLESFDDETRELLGVSKAQDEGFLDIRTQIKLLKAKGKLFDFVSVWASIDLTSFNNSDITTLEEHIKRKWADISAETAGEQYTPIDIIDLISAFSVSYARAGAKFDAKLNLYDMTCGGGNMLYGVEDKISLELPNNTIHSFGQEINDHLYALAKIESRFREQSTIVHGDTLLNDLLSEHDMDIITANPPYGIDFKGILGSITSDETGRFNHIPSTSDGQLLFVQHAVAKLKAHGKALIVLNGSPMFSGDVNSGESLTRKWLLDNDYVESWVQLPKNEFFNTQITTYLWVINKDKPLDRKNKILLINAAEKYKKLKKSKGKKTNEISQEDISWIINAFEEFKTASDDVKLLDKHDFYYNKQQLTLIPKEGDGNFYDHLPQKKVNGILVVDNNEQPIKQAKETIKDTKRIILERSLGERLFITVEGGMVVSAEEVPDYMHKPKDENYNGIVYKQGDGIDKFQAPNKKEDDGSEITLNLKDVLKAYEDATTIIVSAGNATWIQKKEDHHEQVFKDGVNKGLGKLSIKVTWAKGNAKTSPCVKITADVLPLLEKDYEIIPYCPENNDVKIDSFLTEWVRKDYLLGENNVGVEINFNKVFYKPVVLRSTSDIAFDIKAIDAELAELEGELWG
jgi:type I restriction enzyme M protein